MPNIISITDLMIYLIVGLLVGARLGYVLFYDLSYFIQHPLEAFFPFKIADYKLLITGYYGMSYFGGLVGVIAGGFLFSKRNKINFWKLTDFVVPAIPAGYFFGRIGNFLNGELYGRITGKFWGMYFPADDLGFLRHPSQLYEAFFEGIILFLILLILRSKSKFSGYLLAVYFFGYGLFRFFIEFFREPDGQIGVVLGWLTPGQIFSLLLIGISLGIYFCGKDKRMLQSES